MDHTTVTVQLLTSKTGFREFEQQRELSERGLQIDQHSPDESSARKVASSEETINAQSDKVYARAKFRERVKELSSLEEEAGPTEEYADSGVGFDGSSNTSESLYAEKHESSSAHEIDSLRSTVSGDLAGLSLGQNPQLEKGDPPDHRFSAQGTNDWVQGWSSDYSVDNDLVAVYEENSKLRGSLEAAESAIHELKLEVSFLKSLADEVGHEAQKFGKELSAEIVSSEELGNEVSLLKSECSKLKDDLEQLKISKCSGRKANGSEQDQMSQDVMLTWLKGLLAMEEKIIGLQNKACYGYNESDLKFFHSDIVVLLGILQNLKAGTGLTVSSLNLIASEEASLKGIREMGSLKNDQFATGTGFDVDLYQPELGILHCLNMPGLISHESDAVDVTNAMKSKIFELVRELDESKAERESLSKKMHEMECYYEALVQELEENQRQLLRELQNLRNEHSTCMYTVSSTKGEMKSMHQELNEQIDRLAEDNHHLGSLNKELERRAVTAEAALRRARLNYSIAVDQLQKDLEVLSFQVLSMYETNENLIRQAFVDSSPKGFDSQEYSAKLLQLQNQSVGIRKQQLGGDIHLEDLKRSLHLQEGLYRKVEEEVCEMHFLNIYLDVLSKALHETFLRACEDAKLMNEKVNELTQQLELSAESKNVVVQKLQSAMDDVLSLNDYKATCIAKCNDMVLRNQTLEADLQNMTHENYILVQKIAEWESVTMQYRGYEEKLEAYTEENAELTCLLEKKTIENGILQHENFSLRDEMKAIKAEFDELASGKENLQQFISSLRCRLQELLVSYDKSISNLSLVSECSRQDFQSEDLIGIMMHLEELQHNACEKILQLIEEKKCLMHETDAAQLSISAAESEIGFMKRKVEHEIRNMVNKFDESNILLQNLHLDIEAFANRLEVGLEVEEKFEKQHNDLFSGLDHLKVELQDLTSKNKDLANEIMTLEIATAAELTKENRALMTSLQEKSVESSMLSSDLKSLQESLQSLYDENQALIASSRDTAEELNSLRNSLQCLHNENQALVVSSQDKAAEAVKLALELNNLKGVLQSMKDENEALMVMSNDKTEGCVKLASELESLKESLQSLHKEKEASTFLLQDKTEDSARLASELNLLKESLQFLHDENQTLMASLQDKTEESANLGLELNHLKGVLQPLHDEKQALMASLQDKFKEASKLSSDLNSLKESLQTLHEENQVLVACSQDKSEESAKLKSELNSLRDQLQSLHNENRAFVASSRDKNDESIQLASELNRMRESVKSLHHQLHDERSLRENLESEVTDKNSKLNEKECQMLDLHKSVSELELEKLRICSLLSQYEDSLKIAREECSFVSELKNELCKMHELVLATDVQLIFTETQYKSRADDLVLKLWSSDKHLDELQKKHVDLETTLSHSLASEAKYIEENAKLLTSLNSVRSELEASIAENRLFLDANKTLKAELEEYKDQTQDAKIKFCKDESRHSLEVERLKRMLTSSEEEIYSLLLFKEELEVKVLVLKAQLDEQQAQIITMEGYHDELMTLKKQNNELSQRLADQILKTEELKNLSIHLRELKDKADAECVQAREKREPETPPAAMQDSLRIAFIKEQYETRLQELKQQLSISKKHSEEMLWKLQDAIDDNENRKKSEACHLKKNEELGMKILELEAELQSVLSEKRERMNAYDRMKAEMECSLISLECCKEEKQKLEAFLQECNEEKSTIAAELSQMKGSIENSKLAINLVEKENGLVFRTMNQKNPLSDASYLEQDTSSTSDEAENNALLTGQLEQDALLSSGMSGIQSPSLPSEDKLLPSDMKQLVLINDRFRAESLRSSMDHLSNELERMKNENSVVQDDQDFVQKFPALQSQFMQLQKANEELGSMFPLYNQFSGSGGSLERVLALEIELAEALQAKKRSSVHFQSSFLKQHSDEEAIFKSFKDINDLIKDMLELKGRYAAVETELKEMHDRYSDLSLHFAEVEGERQKLMMTLKNVRASKKALHLNRSSSASLGDQL
ncbi:uncharacterized protein LOC126658129 isoform X2 [Mercurialis annua]|uniref:uncharacterized protein LOC126658129 isoform X2 n=1 Tax=Mercurialis annua TaxID=3986 RepID=UPI00215F6C04|nr:uncharacterized protein LOC126658129 isoform X2 [Mercurialis annua]